MASKIELTKTLINALLNENRKSTVTPSQLATLYQHIIGMIEEIDPYTKEETKELIKTANDAVLKTLDQLNKALSQPREFYINDTADKFDATADSYFTEDIDFETIQFIDEEFTGLGADALTLPISICQGGETIATFPAAFTRRPFNEDDPDGWHTYEAHAIFEYAGSVWKFRFDAIPGNHENSIDLVKVSAASPEMPTLDIYLPPEVTDLLTGKQKRLRYWKGHSDKRNIYWGQNLRHAHAALKDILEAPDQTIKTVCLNIYSNEQPYTGEPDFTGLVVFRKEDPYICSQTFRVTKNGLDYTTRLIFSFQEGLFFKLRLLAYPFRPKKTPEQFRSVRGICPAGLQPGLKYKFCNQFRLNLNRNDIISLRDSRALFKSWDLKLIWDLIDPTTLTLIEDLHSGFENLYGITSETISEKGHVFVKSDFTVDTENRRIYMTAELKGEGTLSGVDIRIHTGVKHFTGIAIANLGGWVTQMPNYQIPRFKMPEANIFPESLLNNICHPQIHGSIKAVKDLEEFIYAHASGPFQLQRYRRTKHKKRPYGAPDSQTIKWADMYVGGSKSKLQKGVFRIRYAKTRANAPGPWVYFKFNGKARAKKLKIC